MLLFLISKHFQVSLPCSCVHCYEWFQLFSSKLNRKTNTFLRFGMHLSNNHEVGIWFFVGEKKAFNEGTVL